MNNFDALMLLKKNPNARVEALRVWFDRTFKFMVQKIIYKYHFEIGIAEEIAAETIYKAASKIDEIRNDAALKSWLETILNNACIDQIRKQTYLDTDNAVQKKISPPSVIKQTIKAGIKVTEYSYVEPDAGGRRKLKFNVEYSQLDESGEESASFEEIIDNYAKQINLDTETPEEILEGKNLEDCVQDAIADFEKIDEQKAKAIRLILIDTPKEEIAAQLNKSSKAIREYISQCYKKFKIYVAPCYEDSKLA